MATRTDTPVDLSPCQDNSRIPSPCQDHSRIPSPCQDKSRIPRIAQDFPSFRKTHKFLPVLVQSLAVLEKSPGLVRTGPGLVRLKVALVRTGPELNKSLPVLGNPWQSWKSNFCQHGYHAVRSLQETAKLTDNENVRTAILEGFYVDDFLSGCNTLEDAKGLQDELIATLEKTKLPLRKWVSNDQTLVERLPPDMRGGDLVNLFEADSTIRTLGITWQPQKDHFKFTCTLPKINPPETKRQILSEIAKLFDPIAWLTPITIKAKIWIQRLWTLGLTWDEPLAENLIEEFKADIKGIEILEKFTLNRFITDCDPVKHEIHCFTDASIHAYAATVYLVTEKATGEKIPHLIAAKSKVAPIKTVSLPRLELCGAQLGAKLTDKILKAFKSVNLKNLETFAWTDSTITLAWIQASPSKWNTFVANRVADIQNFSHHFAGSTFLRSQTQQTLHHGVHMHLR